MENLTATTFKTKVFDYEKEPQMINGLVPKANLIKIIKDVLKVE